MKYLMSFLAVCAVLICAIYSFFPTDTIQKDANRLVAKYEPSDEFFLQRAYPDGQFSIAAYTAGLSQAREAAISRSDEGFDTDWKVQGPGNIGARINTVAMDPNDEDIIFVGFSGGGVWKTITEERIGCPFLMINYS